MARIEESIQINCPADRVFTYTTDATNFQLAGTLAYNPALTRFGVTL
jgi:hypothetical protein